MPRAAVLAHKESANDLGLIGENLVAGGWEISRIWREDSPALPDADALLVLGSFESVAKGHCATWADREEALVRTWLDGGRPYLGVCFGAQILARALNGNVERQPQFFRDVRTLPWKDESPKGPWVVWHEDSITSVGAAEVLSELPHAITAFRSAAAWGIQAHIELDHVRLEALARTTQDPRETWQPLVDSLRTSSVATRKATASLLTTVLGT